MAAPKAGTKRASNPSALPVILLTIMWAIILHSILCFGVNALADKVEWHPWGGVANITIQDAQFILNAPLSFIAADLFFGFCFAVLSGFALRVPFFRDRVYHTVVDLKKRLMVQLSATQEEVESILRNDPENNERLFTRREDVNPESAQSEIDAIKVGQRYLEGKAGFMGGISTYMRFHFTEYYSNTVTGLAYAGAAVLIFFVGLRGLKFIPAVKPSLIIFAIGVEFSMLSFLALALIYTEPEERIDRILKQMVDAVKGGKGKAAVAAMTEEEALLSRADYERLVRDQFDQRIVQILQEKDEDAIRRLALDLIAKK